MACLMHRSSGTPLRRPVAQTESPKPPVSEPGILLSLTEEFQSDGRESNARGHVPEEVRVLPLVRSHTCTAMAQGAMPVQCSDVPLAGHDPRGGRRPVRRQAR